MGAVSGAWVAWRPDGAMPRCRWRNSGLGLYCWSLRCHNLLRRFVYHCAIATGRMWATVSSLPLCDQYVESFGISAARISILHDAWGPSHTVLPADRADEGYAFSGGDTARDWDTVLPVAHACSDVPFRIVARRANWHPTGDVPPNVNVRADTSPGEFFSIASRARLVILPLNSNVSDLLVPMGGAEEMASVLRCYWTDHNLRIKIAMVPESHVLEHFSPDAYARQVAAWSVVPAPLWMCKALAGGHK